MAAPSGTRGGTQPGISRYSVPEVARLLGISERAVRKRITTGSLRAARDGRAWTVFLDAVPWGGTSAVPGGPTLGTGPDPDPEPVEPSYRVTPAEVEQAIDRTQARYMADLQVMLDRVGAIYEARLAEKDALIAELRRRAEQAEAESLRLRGQTQSVEAPPSADPPRRRRWWPWGRG